MRGTMIRCVETGESFESYHAAARAKGIAHSNLCRLIKYNMPGTCGGYHWEALNEGAMPTKYTVSGIDGDFFTMKEVAKALGVSRQTVGAALKRGGKIRGHRIQKVDSNDGGSL